MQYPREMYGKGGLTSLKEARNLLEKYALPGESLAYINDEEAKFLKYIFIQSELKAGYINMPDIKTTKFSSDKASQQFEFLQYNIVFGAEFPIYKK